MSHETTKLNGVDLEVVGGLINTVKQNPCEAATQWKATVTWEGAFRSSVKIRDFAPIPSDEPEALGGTDTAPNPAELLLGALGNCLTVGYAANAAAAGITLKDLRIELEGDLDLHTFLGLDQGHAGYNALRVSVHVDADADRETIEALHRKVIGSSPIGHTLQAAVPLQFELA